MVAKICNSCHMDIVNIKGSTSFKCPNCNKHEITRCGHCKILASKYLCSVCSFEGPN